MIISKWKYLKNIYHIIEEEYLIYWFKDKTKFDHRFKDYDDFKLEIEMKWFDFWESNIEWKEYKNIYWLYIKSNNWYKIYNNHKKY